MRNRRGFIIQAVLVSMVGGLVVISACGTVGLLPPSSSDPADVTARIYTTSTLRMSFGDAQQATITPSGDKVLWVANIYAKNKNYPKPMLGTYAEWGIKDGNNTYILPNAMRVLKYEPMMNAEIGQTKEMKTAFEVPSNLNIGDAQLVYLGQQPYSYGSLVDGGRVSAYDFDANKPIAISAKASNIATVERIWVSAIWIGGGSLYVELRPTGSAVANKVYTVELYEKGRLRATAQVSWNQPEINVSTMKPVQFPATRQEAEAYGIESDLGKIFSAKVHE